MKPLTDNEIIDRLGGTFAVAKFFEIKPPSVSGWRTRGIPKARRLHLRGIYPELFAASNPKKPARKKARAQDHDNKNPHNTPPANDPPSGSQIV